MRVIYDSRIEGEFEGWDGDRIYELTNGTRWQQVRYKYRYKYKYRPRAKIIEQNGGKYLEVEGMDESIRVRRV